MIKKAALKATVGTAAASLLFLPGATMVASPSIELMACNYPDSISTVTQQALKRPVQRKGQTNSSFVQVTADRGVAKGRVVVRVARDTRRGYRVIKVRQKQLNRNGRATVALPRNLARGNYRVRANFEGGCRFRNSSDTDFLTVVKRRR